MRQPLHLPVPLLEVTAIYGPLLSLTLRRPSRSLPGSMAKPRPAGCLPRREREEGPAHRMREDTCQGPGLKPRTWETSKLGSLSSQTCKGRR